MIELFANYKRGEIEMIDEIREANLKEDIIMLKKSKIKEKIKAIGCRIAATSLLIFPLVSIPGFIIPGIVFKCEEDDLKKNAKAIVLDVTSSDEFIKAKSSDLEILNSKFNNKEISESEFLREINYIESDDYVLSFMQNTNDEQFKLYNDVNKSRESKKSLGSTFLILGGLSCLTAFPSTLDVGFSMYDNARDHDWLAYVQQEKVIELQNELQNLKNNDKQKKKEENNSL